MITNVVKNADGATVQWTDTSDNCTIRISPTGNYSYFCERCGTPESQMQFLRETGYYNRTVTYRCCCGANVKFSA